MNHLILTTHKLEKIFISSKDFNKTYRIYYNKDEIGIVVCEDWERSPIGLSITTLDHIDEIFAV